MATFDTSEGTLEEMEVTEEGELASVDFLAEGDEVEEPLTPSLDQKVGELPVIMDYCLLCANVAVHYDFEGNIIKREPATQDYSNEDLFSFLCQSLGVRKTSKLKKDWKFPKDPFPFCEKCEEVLVWIADLYSKLAELEANVRDSMKAAEEKYYNDELYDKHDARYFEFRKFALGGSFKGKPGDNGKRVLRPRHSSVVKLDYETVTPDLADSVVSEDHLIGADPLTVTFNDSYEEGAVLLPSPEPPLLESATTAQVHGHDVEDDEDPLLPVTVPQSENATKMCTRRTRQRKRTTPVMPDYEMPELPAEGSTSRPQDARLGENKENSLKSEIFDGYIVSYENMNDRTEGLPPSDENRGGGVGYLQQNNIKTEEVPVRRRRGRKKGSKNKKHSKNNQKKYKKVAVKTEIKMEVNEDTFGQPGLDDMDDDPTTNVYSQNVPLVEDPISRNIYFRTLLFVRLDEKRCFQCSTCSEMIPFAKYSTMHHYFHSHFLVYHSDLYQCQYCTEFNRFQNRHELQLHMNTVHRGIGQFIKRESNEAQAEFSGRRKYKQRRERRPFLPNKKQAAQSTSCPICGMPVLGTATSDYRNHYLSHLNKTEKKAFLIKEENSQKTEYKALFKKHRKREKLDERKVYKKRDWKDMEQSSKGSVKLPTCTICCTPFKSERKLEFHMQATHSSNRSSDGAPEPFKCLFPNCGVTYLCESDLQSHVGEAHANSDKTENMCRICGRVFIYPARLKTHEMLHTGAKKFGCHLCPNMFSHKDTLKDHLAVVHRNEGDMNLFSCDQFFCNATFPSKYELMAHLQTSHNIQRRSMRLGKIEF